MPEWIRALAATRPFGAGDRRGTANLIDSAARARGAACISTGSSVSLARPLLGGDYNSTQTRPGFHHETWYNPAPDGMGWGQDHLVLNPHGLQNTHLDALNHVAVDGTFYGGRPVTDAEQGSADVLAPDGLVTRAIYVDIPHHRGTAWADRPVDGADIDAALAGAGLAVESGDALLLDMGFLTWFRWIPLGTRDTGAWCVVLALVVIYRHRRNIEPWLGDSGRCNWPMFCAHAPRTTV